MKPPRGEALIDPSTDTAEEGSPVRETLKRSPLGGSDGH